MTTAPHALILRAPGTNCDVETEYAFQLAGARTCRMHIHEAIRSAGILRTCQIVCLPGGFSYGDDIAAGRILARQLTGRLADELADFRDRGNLILGICNGFQVLIQSDLLLSEVGGGALALNRSGRFECRWVHLSVGQNRSPFLRGMRELYLPVAHAEGRFTARNPEVVDRLAAAGQVALRYAPGHPRGTSEDLPAVPYPWNPNGSMRNVAGICDPTGRVLGLMPHPERFVDWTQHPRWTREPVRDGDGIQIFRNAVDYFQG